MNETRKLMAMLATGKNASNEEAVRREITAALDAIFQTDPSIYSTEEIVIELLRRIARG